MIKTCGSQKENSVPEWRSEAGLNKNDKQREKKIPIELKLKLTMNYGRKGAEAVKKSERKGRSWENFVGKRNRILNANLALASASQCLLGLLA